MRQTPACGINPEKALLLVLLSAKLRAKFAHKNLLPISTILLRWPPSTISPLSWVDSPSYKSLHRKQSLLSFTLVKVSPIPQHHFSPLILSDCRPHPHFLSILLREALFSASFVLKFPSPKPLKSLKLWRKITKATDKFSRRVEEFFLCFSFRPSPI